MQYSNNQIKNRLPIPHATKLTVWDRAGNKCESCKAAFSSKLGFSFHHIVYEREIEQNIKSESVFGDERPNELQWLCWSCHQAKHRGPLGEFYLDPQEAAAEWNYYHHLMEKD
jgi:5-methylcytosine-specific restriction endonuclease McrA